ncbi:hypothetical protein PUR50_27780, partial [Enterobacter hormaechei subsp. steigerwaltii]|nr:hypothetical protein [Enterobacter hormaechei subsp. steigerwaltii]
MKQQIQLRRREVDETADLPAELPPLLRRLYASRGVRSAQELERSVKGMLPWQQLSGVEITDHNNPRSFAKSVVKDLNGLFDAAQLLPGQHTFNTA